MVGRMQIPDDNITTSGSGTNETDSKGSKTAAGLDNLIPNGGDPTSGRSSPNVPKYKEELEILRKKSEQEQMKRIKKRQQVCFHSKCNTLYGSKKCT